MSAKSILEADGKAILNYHLTRAPVIKPSPLPKSETHNPPPKLASIYFAENEDVSAVLDQAETSYPWLLVPGAKFVAKIDQLIKRRGKSGLLALNKTWPEAKAWIAARAGKPQQVESVVGVLRQFLVEPFVPHPDGTEYYININSQREVSFSLQTKYTIIGQFPACMRALLNFNSQYFTELDDSKSGNLEFQSFISSLSHRAQRIDESFSLF